MAAPTLNPANNPTSEPTGPVLRMTRDIQVHDAGAVMLNATEIGRDHGHERNWKPVTVAEAIETLEDIGVGSPLDHGYEITRSTVTTMESTPAAPLTAEDVLRRALRMDDPEDPAFVDSCADIIQYLWENAQLIRDRQD